MLTKKQFFVLLSIYVLYLLVGAAVFYHIESIHEAEEVEIRRKERQEIEELLNKHYVPTDEDTQEEIFNKLTTYCGHPMTHNMTQIEDPPKWDYYHSVFFVITVVTTVGYGTYSSTTTLSRIFLIFYALIGIPINGFVIVAMGGYFRKSFESLYNRWKKSNRNYDFARLGLITQIILYLLPGFMFFIFIPALIFMLFEGWPYDVAVYYAFVTLSTVGFGDYCAGMDQYDHSSIIYWIYKIFLLFWIIIGLGYLGMIISYISAAMTSKKVIQLEHLIATHIKKTPHRIRDELRTLLNEATLMRVKRVYKHSIHDHHSHVLGRSQSCPDLKLFVHHEDSSAMRKRKRALSECPYGKAINRICSDTDLQLIDKEKTFGSREVVTEPSELLLRVVNALGGYEEDVNVDEKVGLDLFSDSQILASEENKLSALPVQFDCRRGSEGRVSTCDRNERNLTWYGQSAAQKLQELRERVKYGKCRRMTLAEPVIRDQQQPSLLTRIKNTFKSSSKDEKKNLDVESQEYIQKTPRGRWSIMVDEQDKYLRQTRGGRLSNYSNRDLDPVLENTSVAEFIRALTEISYPEPLRKYEAINTSPKRKLGVASMTPPTNSPPRTRRQAIQPQSRRSSLIPDISTQSIRRFSLRPVVEDRLTTENESKDFRESGSPLKFLFRPRGRTGSISVQKEAEVESQGDLPPPYSIQDTAKGVNRAPVLRRYSLKSGSVTQSPVQKQVQRKEKDKEEHDKCL